MWSRALLAAILTLAAAPAGAEPARSDATARLIQTAPYKLEVASSDGNKVLITNAFTLERRRLWERPGVAALAFSPDGVWLYAVTSSGEAVAIDPDAGKVVPLGKLPIQAGEQVVDAVGIGPTDQFGLAAILAKPQGPVAARGCSTWTVPRRVVLHRAFDGTAPRLEAREGWPDDQRTPRTRAVSPNTKTKVSIAGPALQAEAQFGAGGTTISKTALPVGAFQIDWMRDSQGLALHYPKRAEAACKFRVGTRFYRQEGGWTEWNLPDGVDTVRGDQPWPTPAAAPDGMRWLGTSVRGVELIEPLPRFRGKVALIAPPSSAWPKLRPGVRALPSLVGGPLRLAELWLETGDLDQAGVEIDRAEKTAAPAAVAKLRGRLQKLIEVRARRAQELALPLVDLRSNKQAPAAATTGPTAPDDDAVEPPAAPTPTRVSP
ncbi:MAG: hypothetical protein HY902_14665 [Deltaproteobacteria bacterium]|nr:hypothetical protein [Deltaproteobacteria bacterium]